MQTKIQKPRTNAELNLHFSLEGSRIGDMVVYTNHMTADAEQVPCAVCIRAPIGGTQYPKTYAALLQLQSLMKDKPLPHKKSIPQAQMGKAIIMDSDGNDNFLILEGTSDRWVIQTYQVSSGFGVATEFYKADLSADENKAFSALLAAMQKEQTVTNKAYERLLEEQADTKQLIEHSSYAANMWQRLNDMQQQLNQLGARTRG